jgi:hypothetical protein
MHPVGGWEQPPPLTPSSDEATFKRLILAQGKKKGGVVPKFVKKLDEVPVIDLPPAQPMRVVVSLADRSLV